jgi:hypothetical protein
VVQLTAGAFIISGGNFLLINKGITLRGAGSMPGNAGEDRRYQAIPSGGQRQTLAANHCRPVSGGIMTRLVGSADLTADAVKGANTVTVASATGF